MRYLYQCFVDLENADVSINRERPWYKIWKKGVSENIVGYKENVWLNNVLYKMELWGRNNQWKKEWNKAVVLAHTFLIYLWKTICIINEENAHAPVVGNEIIPALFLKLCVLCIFYVFTIYNQQMHNIFNT